MISSPRRHHHAELTQHSGQKINGDIFLLNFKQSSEGFAGLYFTTLRIKTIFDETI